MQTKTSKQLQKKQQRKEKRKAISEAKKYNGGSKNRITEASFIRQWDEDLERYVYVLKAKRAGKEFVAYKPVDFDRDKYLELLLIYNVTAIQWQWQQPDCESYLNLIINRIHPTGNEEHLNAFHPDLTETEDTGITTTSDCGGDSTS